MKPSPTPTFSGIWVPLITPFSGGRVDHDALARLAVAMAAARVAGFVVCGSTGEAAALDDAEQAAVLKTVHRAAPDVPLLMGVGGVVPQAVAARLQHWVDVAPLAGFLVTAPSYVKPSQAGIADFFTVVADASPLPIVLYDIPGRTGVRIETATMLALAAHPRIRAVKDCSADLDHLQAVLSDGRLAVLAGDDTRMFASMCLGGSGAIAASAHLRPELFVRLHRLVALGDLAEARRLWRGLWPLTVAAFAEPNPALIKAGLASTLGLPAEVRAPMTPASAGAGAALQRLLDGLAGETAAGA